MTAIRPAQPHDVVAVGALIDAAYEHYIPILGRKPRPMLDDHHARIARGETFLLEDGEELLGLISIAPDESALHIFNLAVVPKAQGLGLLHDLLGFAATRARELRLPRLTLFTNVLMTHNRAIYAHLGFVETKISDGGGYQIVAMERPVKG